MQSDTFINDTDSDDENSDYESDSSGDLPKNNNIGVFYKYDKNELETKRFMDQSSASNYEQVRSQLFSKPIVKGRICIDSSNYRKTNTFNSSNYVATFSDVKSVIGFSLVRANIRVPQYNVNNTNNVIWYSVGTDEYSVTINPGYYTVTELATALPVITASKTHRVTYSSGSHHFTSDTVYYSADSTTTDNDKHGMIFKLVNSSSIKFLWAKNNVTKGAARLFGFHPVNTETANTTHYSEKPPDFSQHHVDLCIPEIPDMACKRSIFNRGEKNIIERIPLTNSTGSYQYYETDHLNNNYFTPIKLDKLNIQLYSDNDEIFDSQNTDNSFEFEVTVLVGRG